MEVRARCVACHRPLTLSWDPAVPTPRTCGKDACRKVAAELHDELERLERRAQGR